MDVVDDGLLSPRGELARRLEDEVEPAGAACLSDEIDRLVERAGGGVDVALADVGECEVAEHDRARLLAVVQPDGGVGEQLGGLDVLAEREVAGAGQAVELGLGEEMGSGVVTIDAPELGVGGGK